MKELKVYIQFKTVDNKKQAACICMSNNKRCMEKCERETVSYDEYRGWKECFKNRDRGHNA